MNKVLKGYELMKEIAEGNIKENDRIKFNGTFYIYNGFTIKTECDETYLTDWYGESEIANGDFEIIQDEIEIEETNWQEVGELLGKMYLELGKGFEKAIREFNRKLEEK